MESIWKELKAKLEVVKILEGWRRTYKRKTGYSLHNNIKSNCIFCTISGNQLMEIDGLILGLTT
jgi:hypothetical protein